MTNVFNMGPTPPYNNPAIEPQYFTPKAFLISDVTLGQTTIVTTVMDMDYYVGNLVRLVVPPAFGCYQLNGITGLVIAILADNQVELDIDSSQNVDPYVTSMTSRQYPQIIAIGDLNSGSINAYGSSNTQPFIDGSFRNISPY